MKIPIQFLNVLIAAKRYDAAFTTKAAKHRTHTKKKIIKYNRGCETITNVNVK